MSCPVSGVRKLDEIAHRFERIWGVDRLPFLVSDFLRVKFESQQERLNTFIESNDEPAIQKAAAGMIRGWELLDAEAREAGHRPLVDTIWTVKHPDTGKLVSIYNSEVSLVDLQASGGVAFSLQELVQFIPALVLPAKLDFPGCTVEEVKDFDDENPF